jgi:type IV secretory pathway VirB10-like protein
MPQMPGMSSWVAPTLNVEEVEKRISELKAVQFWLDQNGKALAATIQALEVQKMTLATLKTMNFNMAELTESFKVKPVARAPAAEPDEQPEPAQPRASGAHGNGAGGAAPVDPVQWWSALTQQFQEIAADAMKDVAQKANADSATHKAKPPAAAAPAPIAATAKKSRARKSASGKSAARKSRTR